MAKKPTIRPLTKISEGVWRSRDGDWLFERYPPPPRKGTSIWSATPVNSATGDVAGLPRIIRPTLKALIRDLPRG